VAGTFNDWNPTTKSMHSSGNGHWLIETALAPGTYEYCLVVDGQWIPDPLAKAYVSNPFGGKNSILEVVSSPGRKPSKTTAGLWIDHRKAVITIISGEGEKNLVIQSHVEKQPGRFAGVRSTTRFRQSLTADDSREREFTGHLNQFYTEVIAAIRDAESILLLGPGEAKNELKKRLERGKLGAHIIAIETADKMTDRQIAAKVREHFHK
jgi:hypothetical protein